MSDIEDQAAARVEKAETINAEVYARLHQYDTEDFGVKAAKGNAPRKPAKIKVKDTADE